MRNVCRNCGAPLGANFAFCPQCRTPAAGGVGPAAPVTPAAKIELGHEDPACRPLRAGGWWRGGLGRAVLRGARVKQAVVARASEYGVDLPLRGTVLPSHYRVFQHPCDLLTGEEAASLLGEPIDRTEVRIGVVCIMVRLA